MPGPRSGMADISQSVTAQGEKSTNQKLSKSFHEFGFIFAIRSLIGTHAGKGGRDIEVNPNSPAAGHNENILRVNIPVMNKGTMDLLYAMNSFVNELIRIIHAI